MDPESNRVAASVARLRNEMIGLDIEAGEYLYGRLVKMKAEVQAAPQTPNQVFWDRASQARAAAAMLRRIESQLSNEQDATARTFCQKVLVS
jgi:hypothetical protein